MRSRVPGRVRLPRRLQTICRLRMHEARAIGALTNACASTYFLLLKIISPNCKRERGARHGPRRVPPATRRRMAGRMTNSDYARARALRWAPLICAPLIAANRTVCGANSFHIAASVPLAAAPQQLSTNAAAAPPNSTVTESERQCIKGFKANTVEKFIS
ncbi:hypothetical protein EVAR_68095_1 [Eumeta japonica]|uniref:Uncharacterized protein n=1 Tax=Eumeta variegata TaxID=151549 RepID=A0A4C2A1T8_EUMVA|nr:hypothetical protein EVAR_68095_1 [Eumeta japonica]